MSLKFDGSGGVGRAEHRFALADRRPQAKSLGDWHLGGLFRRRHARRALDHPPPEISPRKWAAGRVEWPGMQVPVNQISIAVLRTRRNLTSVRLSDSPGTAGLSLLDFCRHSYLPVQSMIPQAKPKILTRILGNILALAAPTPN